MATAKIAKVYTFVKVTRDNVETCNMFYHVKFRNADGTPARARRNGTTKTWKRNPARFSVPCKHGMYDFLYITEENMAEWAIDYTEVTPAE